MFTTWVVEFNLNITVCFISFVSSHHTDCSAKHADLIFFWFVCFLSIKKTFNLDTVFKLFFLVSGTHCSFVTGAALWCGFIGNLPTRSTCSSICHCPRPEDLYRSGAVIPITSNGCLIAFVGRVVMSGWLW